MTLTIKDKIQLGIAGTMILLGLIYFLRTGLLQSRKPAEISDAENTVHIQTEGISETPLSQIWSDGPVNAFLAKNVQSDIHKEQEKKAKQPWGRDPFFALSLVDTTPAPEANMQASGLALSGISLKGPQAVAIVNHTIIHEGDEVFGMKVLSIKKNHVVMDRNGDEFVLRFGGPQ